MANRRGIVAVQGVCRTLLKRSPQPAQDVWVSLRFGSVSIGLEKDSDPLRGKTAHP